MAISFSGLATGIDTNALVTSLMELEKAPLERLEVDKTWQSTRLDAFKQFDSLLSNFKSKIDGISDQDQYYRMSASAESDDFFTVSADNEAVAGNYQIEVHSLAQVQKSYSNTHDGVGNDLGFSSKDDNLLGTGAFIIQVNGIDQTITLDAENNTLQGLMDEINDADIGVQASIINDGNASPYRLTLTATTVENSFSVDSSNLSGGTEQFQDFTVSQAAAQAQIDIDGLTVYSDSNTFSDRIPGITIELLKAAPDTATKVAVTADKSALEANLQSFVSGFNGVVSFITSQAKTERSEAGILAGDSALNSVKRHLQGMLTQANENSGAFTTLSAVGFETQRDGTLVLNTSTLGDAIDQDFDSLVSLLAGTEGEDGGIIAEFEDYLASMTDDADGFYAAREEAISDNIAGMDSRIEMMTLRLEKREETLRAQFSAMEQLVSTMNAQGDYLNQQLSLISNLTNQ